MEGQWQVNVVVENQQQRPQKGQSVTSDGMQTDSEQDKENNGSVLRSRRFFWKLGKKQLQPLPPTKATTITTETATVTVTSGAPTTSTTSTTSNASNPASNGHVPAVSEASEVLVPERVVASTTVPCPSSSGPSSSFKPALVGSSLPPAPPRPKATSSIRATAASAMASLTMAATTSLTTFQDIQDMTRELQTSLFGKGDAEAATTLHNTKSSDCSNNDDNNNNDNSIHPFLCLLRPFCSEELPIITTKDVDDDDIRVQFYPTMSTTAATTTPMKKQQRQGSLAPTPSGKQSPTSVLEEEVYFVLGRGSDVFDSMSDGKEPEEDAALSSLWMSPVPSPQRVVHSATVASEIVRGCRKPAPDTTVSRPLPLVIVKAQSPSMRSSALNPEANKKSLTTTTVATTSSTAPKTKQQKEPVASKSRRGTHVKPLSNAKHTKEDDDASATTCSNSCDSDNHIIIASAKKLSKNIKNKKHKNKVPLTAARRVPRSASSSASSSSITDLVWSVLEGVWNFTQDEVSGFDDNGTIDNYTIGGHDEEDDSSNQDSMDSRKESGDDDQEDENENVMLLVEPPIGSFIDTLGWQDEDIYNYVEHQGGTKGAVPRTRRRTTRTRTAPSSDEESTSILATHSQSQPPGLEGLLMGLCKL